MGTRATAPIAGANVNQSPMVTTIAVTYPNGWIPTSVRAIPAKIINTHALTKNMGPADTTLKKLRTANTSWSHHIAPKGAAKARRTGTWKPRVRTTSLAPNGSGSCACQGSLRPSDHDVLTSMPLLPTVGLDKSLSG